MSCVELLAVLVQGGNELDGRLQAGERRFNSLVCLNGICELPDELKGTDIEQPCFKQRFHVDGHAASRLSIRCGQCKDAASTQRQKCCGLWHLIKTEEQQIKKPFILEVGC